MNLDPSTFPARYDVWTAPGVERFNYCWVTTFTLAAWILSWESPLKRLEIEDYFAHVGDDVMVATILRKTLNMTGDDYERQILIYAESDDFLMLDKIVHADDDDSGPELSECLFWSIHRKHAISHNNDIPAFQ